MMRTGPVRLTRSRAVHVRASNSDSMSVTPERAAACSRAKRAGSRAVQNNLITDQTVRENVRAGLRVIIKRVLRKHGYPPDKQEKATQTVLEQAESLSRLWTNGEG